MNRLQIRIDEEAYSILEKAARYQKDSLSHFIREASLKEAEKVIQEHETMVLSEQDWSLLMKAMSEPLSPNEALRKAYTNYKIDREE